MRELVANVHDRELQSRCSMVDLIVRIHHLRVGIEFIMVDGKSRKLYRIASLQNGSFDKVGGECDDLCCHFYPEKKPLVRRECLKQQLGFFFGYTAYSKRFSNSGSHFHKRQSRYHRMILFKERQHTRGANILDIGACQGARLKEQAQSSSLIRKRRSVREKPGFSSGSNLGLGPILRSGEQKPDSTIRSNRSCSSFVSGFAHPSRHSGVWEASLRFFATDIHAPQRMVIKLHPLSSKIPCQRRFPQ